ncbi:MAG: DEAD/DEAH box helicase [Clostridia bacterium]|nr:DEAD/DEAH box helicase [Clostridia bacterium]
MTGYEQRLRSLAGEEERAAGQQLAARGGVRILVSSAEGLTAMAADQPPREVSVRPEGARCSCQVFAARRSCRHLVAALICASADGLIEPMLRRAAMRRGQHLLDGVTGFSPAAPILQLEVTLHVDGGKDGGCACSLRTGEDKTYVVRSLPAFFAALRTGASLPFGKGFTLEPDRMDFTPEDHAVLSVVAAVSDTQRAAGYEPRGTEAKLLPLEESGLRLLLSALKTRRFRVSIGGAEHMQEGLTRQRVPLRFRLSGPLRALQLDCDLPASLRMLTSDCRYVLAEGVLIRTEHSQRRFFRKLLPLTDDPDPLAEAGGDDSRRTVRVIFPAGEAERVLGELVPLLQQAGALELDQGLERHLVREPLTVRVYLDREGRDVAARVRYVYGEREIDPFQPARGPEAYPDGKLLLRNVRAEQTVLELLDTAGFMVRAGRALLSGADAVWRFVTGGVQSLRAAAEVYLSREFSRLSPRRPQWSGAVSLRGGALHLEVTDAGEPEPELGAILAAIARKRSYFRLKDGSFLDLTGLAAWQDTAEAIGLSGTSAEEGSELVLPAWQAEHLSRLTEAGDLLIRWEQTVRDAVRSLRGELPETVPLPDGMALRPYQQAGFRWLCTLDRLQMGGILADDMGLGKTVQLLALLQSVRDNAGETGRQVSLIVAPTSLTYHWLSECRRFAPGLRILLLSGSQSRREELLASLRDGTADADVAITSYPLLRRDIDLMDGIQFRVVALDEAQQVKNAGSLSAASVRRLKARSRFCLTGTPLENHAGELWSLFDFVLPGYLGSYADFMQRYQDGGRSEELRARLRPFLLRRLKRDVLPELPEKLETTLTAVMTPEQAQVYRAAQLRLGRQVERVLGEKGLQRGRIEILAAITELREVCCHPALVMDGYTGSSGKLAMLEDLMPGILASGRRVLLFSQFTSMLRILRRHLESDGVRCLYLDGDTPAAQRQQLAERFNAGEGEVFLVSLKAGGTGLNLTGASLVIHYDPWWNPAAEDQASDRAHRIGQTRCVEVLRLITHGTIEEQVAALGERKRALFDRLITPGGTPITNLTERDIRRLFSGEE